MVNILLEYGADKTLVNEDGMTAYDYALETGSTELIELLRFE
jgi:ankyrin repeat protein